jgi:CheY-like chemotaxis protein
VAGRILVAGDDGITALDIEETLAANGYEVAMAVPVKPRVIRLALRTSPDLVVLDTSAYSFKGVATARQMCGSLRIPVVLLTAFLRAEIEQYAELAGPMSYLSKPFRDHDLLRVVRKSLSGEPVERFRAP